MNKTLDKNRQMKDSEIEWIGKIPKEWELKNMKYFIKYKKGKTPNSLNSEKVGTPYIGASDLEDNKFLYNNYTTELLTTCNKEDVLVLWDGARAGLIGYGHEGIIASTIVSISIVNHKLLSQFLFYLLKGFETHLISLTNGTTIPHMSRSFINELGLPLPYLYEQQAIANYLDEQVGKIDELIAEQKQAIENWKAYKQSLITEKVTKGLNSNVEMKDSGVEWMGEIPKEWGIRKVKDIFKIGRGRVISKLELDDDGIYPVFSSQTLNNGCLGYINTYDFDCEQLTWTTDGANAGEVFYREGKHNCTNVCGTLQLKNKLSYLKFKSHYLRFATQYYKRPDTNGAKIMNNEMANILLLIPPLNEQQAIANYLDGKCSKIDQMIEQKQVFINQLEEYKQSLIYECVTGKRCVL